MHAIRAAGQPQDPNGQGAIDIRVILRFHEHNLRESVRIHADLSLLRKHDVEAASRQPEAETRS